MWKLVGGGGGWVNQGGLDLGKWGNTHIPSHKEL